MSFIIPLGVPSLPAIAPVCGVVRQLETENTAHLPPASICNFNVSDPCAFSVGSNVSKDGSAVCSLWYSGAHGGYEALDDEYRTEKLSPKALYKVHVAYDSHFMYYLTSKQLAGEKGTRLKRLGALGVLLLMLKKNDFSNKHRSSAAPKPNANRARPTVRDLFIRDATVVKERGVRCRLGMRGIIADGHIDGGLNHISMIRGTKRYIIAPPSACKCLGLMIQGQSARHTSFNWSDTSALSEDARKCPAAEVALIAGEVLYLPSYWYHPWTLIQCNLRSGVAIRDDTKQFLSDCGFGPPK
ncbi:hypothetical protein GQ600_14569 [Phytophthora cactorum]|nr:hypothetical protein GQ600_14569 [Phytophthora cactorum]